MDGKEQQEPVAEVLYAGMLDVHQRLQFIVVKELLPDHMKLYAAPPQDAVLAMLKEWNRSAQGDGIDGRELKRLVLKTEKVLDAAMRSEGSHE